MHLGLTGRRAAIAAASDGLGLATARALARDGVRVAICGRRAERLELATQRLEADGAAPEDVHALVADVGTPEGASAFVEQAAEALGGTIDILVPNAGGPPPGTFATTELADYQAALELNLLSTVAMCRAAVPDMRRAGWGRVVAITSIGARQPIGALMASSVARAGVTSFLKVLAGEVAGDGVTVNSVQPGVHRTERIERLAPNSLDALLADVPAGRLGDPDDFGAVVAFLCSRQAAFVTGAALVVDGGASRALQ